DPTNGATAVSANDKATKADPKPTLPASAGRQVSDDEGDGGGNGKAVKAPAKAAPSSAPRAQAVVKQRLFAHPMRPNPKKHGGMEQAFDHDQKSGGKKGVTTYRNYFARGLSLNSRDATLKRLKKGSRVIAGTV